MDTSQVYVHPTAVIESAEIGAGSKIWHFCHVLAGARIGKNCVLGQNVTVAGKAIIGNHCKIQNNVSLYDGVILEDYVFCGPSCVFTNILTPRCEIPRRDKFISTRVCHGTSIGANATIVCGVTLAPFTMVAAGAVVTKDSRRYSLLVGVPARHSGWAGRHGLRLRQTADGSWQCPESGWLYREESGNLTCISHPDDSPSPRPLAEGSEPEVNLLFIDHTQYPSGAAISLGTLVRYLPSRVKRHFIVRKHSRVSGLLGATNEHCHVEYFMPDFPTTCFSPKPYSILLWAWHFAKLPLAFYSFWRLCTKWRIDLVHANESCLIGYVFMAWLLGKPIVLHARCSVAKRGLPLWLLKLGAHCPSLRVIAIDEETYRSLPLQLRNKATTVYNPVVIQPIDSTTREDLRRQWGISKSDVAVGQVANLHAGKGVWEMFELAKRICPSHPNIKFVFVGNDSAEYGQAPALRAAARQHGLDKNILFTGHVTEPAKAYAALDIVLCLFAFRLNGVGRTVYEAALARRPTIAVLQTGESSPTLLNGALAIACHPNDLDTVKRHILDLAADPQHRATVANRAHEAIGSRHDPVGVAQQVEGVYRQLLAAKFGIVEPLTLAAGKNF